jgi:hypothetical protein
METYWTTNGKADRLIVIVLGWASDYRAAERLRPADSDILYIYDFRHIAPLSDEDTARIKTYAHRTLLAWSFGVWVAEQILGNTTFDRAIALGGTPLPVNAQYGIEPRRLDVTIRGLRNGGMEAFVRRTYGEFYEENKAVASPRSLEDNIEELITLRDAAQREYTPVIEWNTAIIGSRDVIFPPENMVRFWGNRAQVVPLPHYPFGDMEVILNAING